MPDGVHDDGDPLMVTWVLAWVAHQLPRAPAHLFDANIFYPERNTLAYSETLLVPGIVAAPLHWLGVAPILDLQPGVSVRLRAVRRRRRAAGAAAHRPHRRRDPRRDRLRVSAAIASITTRTCSCSRRSSFRWRCGRFTACSTARPAARRRAARRVRRACQMLSCMYYGIFLIPVHGRRLRHDADRRRGRCRASAWSRCWSAAARSSIGGDDSGRARLPGRARAWSASAGAAEVADEQRDVAQLSGAAGDERGLRQGVCAVHAARAPAVSRVRRGRARDRRPVAAAAMRRGSRTRLGLLLAFDVSLGFNGRALSARSTTTSCRSRRCGFRRGWG